MYRDPRGGANNIKGFKISSLGAFFYAHGLSKVLKDYPNPEFRRAGVSKDDIGKMLSNPNSVVTERYLASISMESSDEINKPLFKRIRLPMVIKFRLISNLNFRFYFKKSFNSFSNRRVRLSQSYLNNQLLLSSGI
ncbi:MAG: hypothetical protein GY834_11150 [Bacteroidetes bacterium]|nr:hypothetical protein [Bacteroidota bacterium]